MKEFETKLKAVIDQQEVINETEKRLSIDQAMFDAKWKDMMLHLGFKEDEPIKLSTLISRAIDRSKAE